MNEIIQLISNVGFPIACTIALFYLMNKEREAHAEETSKITQAINNNTIALNKLLEKENVQWNTDNG